MQKSLQFVANVLLLSAIGLAQTTGKVNVYSPVSGSTVTSPVHFVASAQAPANHYITAMRIYVDYVSVYYVRAAKLDTYVSMTAGTHRLTVQAWDNSGTVYKQWLSLTVKASSVSVSISPTSATLQNGASSQFTAAVTGTTNTSVTWLVNGTQGGNSTVGTISSSGLYTAPAAVPSGSLVTVTAKSVADTTKSASASVTIVAGPTPVSVAISPTSVTLQGGQSKQFTASVTGTTNTSITWQVAGVTGGNSTVGRISSTGLYTAPACPAASSETVTARSVYDSAAYANATVTLSGGAATGTGGNYYVATTGSDSNDGSACHPWATIQHAAKLAQPGWTVHVAPGTYTENGLNISTSGTASQRIRFVSDTRWGAKITVTSSYTVVTIGGFYVDFDGFEVEGASGTCLGIRIDNSFERVLNNHVHHIPTDVGTLCNGNGGAGIDSTNYTGSDNDIIGNVVHDVGSITAPNQAVHGIYVSNARCRVQNNISFHNAAWGIHLYHAATNDTVSNNTVFENGAGGIVLAASIGTNDYSIVNNNIVVHNFASGYYNDGYGIQERSGTGTHNQYHNNLVYQNARGGFSLQNGLTATGTVTADPQFVSYTGTLSGDYHLQSTSPAVNAGTSQAAPAIDMDGGARPYSGYFDIGSYEWGSTPGAWPWQ